MKQSDLWIIPQNERPPEQFWKDFGKFVLASMNCDDSDHYWDTLIKWADILMKRYNNHVVNMMVMDYIDGQSVRAIKKEKERHEKARTSANKVAEVSA